MFYFVLEQSYKQRSNCHQLVFLASEMDGNFHINTTSEAELIQCDDSTAPIPHKNYGLPVSYLRAPFLLVFLFGLRLKLIYE
jgi:hypothetical protein